jgi:hypothetical protein
MKRIALLVVMVLLLTGCLTPGAFVRVAGSGVPVTQEYDFNGFTKVQAGSAFQVDVKQGETYGVAVTVDKNLQPYLDVRMEGDTLRIFLKPGISLSTGASEMQAEVTMPELAGLDFSGASRANVSGFDSIADLMLQASGASRIDGDLTAGVVQLNLSGASRAMLRGAGDLLDLKASGASDAALRDFPVNEATVNLSGASRADVEVNGPLDVEVSGASRVTYGGDTDLGSVDSSGASDVVKR